MPTIQSEKSDKKKQTYIIYGVVGASVLLAGYLLFDKLLFSQKELPASSIQKVQGNNRNIPVGQDPTPQYSELLHQHNEARADEALKTNKSHVSVLENVTRSNARPSPPKKVIEPQQRTIPRRSYQQTKPAKPSRELKLYQEAVQQIISQPMYTGHGFADVEEGSEYVQSISQTYPDPASSETPPSVLINAFEIFPALLMTSLDTDENSVVTAYVPSGKYKGMQLMADGYTRQFESISMTFTQMKWNGTLYSIQAKPVDPQTMRTALHGEVDNRYMERIILPSILGGIGKAGSLYERASEANIITENAVIQTYPETPNGRNVAGTIVGGMADTAGRVLTADAARIPPKQVTLDKNATIGVQFIKPVLSSDIQLSESNSSVDTPSSASSRYTDSTFPTPREGK